MKQIILFHIAIFCLLINAQSQVTDYLHRGQLSNADFYSIRNSIDQYYLQHPNQAPSEGDLENDFNRWKWFWQSRLDQHDGQTGRFDAGTRALEDYLANRELYCSSTGGYQGE
jgi:hypothetical protein